MKKELSGRVAQSMNYLYAHWPQVTPYIPDEINEFDNGFGRGTGLCTHPELINDIWISSNGYKTYAEATIPEGFCCLGLQNRGGSEYVFIMWLKNGRKFWFYDQYVVLVGTEFPASKKRTRERIDKAFERWKNTDGEILYTGIYDEFM